MVHEFMHVMRLALVLPLALVLLGTSGIALADPPSRTGRLSVVQGEVAIRRDGERNWESATPNLPLTTGDELATDPGGRAEVRIGSSVLRLDEATAIAVRRLDDERIRVRLIEGSVALRIRSPDPEAAIEVETPDGVALPAEPGQYRVDFIDAATLVSNYRGQLDFRSDGRYLSISEGRRAQLWKDGRGQVQWDQPDEDDFIEWSFARDRRDDRLARKRYVSPEMTGAEDLYEYGDWREYDDYGPVWFPRDVPYGWAPYRYGRWVSIAPWGWTWVDDAPWGFAPFHYGRWVRIRGTWAWVPGRYVARPVYAPALVAWIGTPGISITIGSGLPSVGWFPLAPREVYVPLYRYSTTYVREVNITHVTNVVEIERVVRTPQQVRYAFRDRQDAVTRATERILRPPRPVTVDAERRREHRVQEWERRGFPVRQVVQQEGARTQEIAPAPVSGEAPLVQDRERRLDALRAQQQREREERAERSAREQEQQRQRRILREQDEVRRDQAREDRREELDSRSERREKLREQQAREREERTRRDAAEEQELQRQRQLLREQEERRREDLRRGDREQGEQRQPERSRIDAQRQQEAREREERRQASEQQRERDARQQQMRQQAEQEDRRRDAARQQADQQRERDARQQQMRQQAEQEERRRDAVRQQAEQQREQEARQQQMRQQAEQEERRRDAARQQVEQQRERDARQQQAREQAQQQAQQEERRRDAMRQQAEQHREQQRDRAQREPQQQDNRRGGDEDPRRRGPSGQEGGRP